MSLSAARRLSSAGYAPAGPKAGRKDVPNAGRDLQRLMLAAQDDAQQRAGGLVGSAVLGQIFDRLGWAACVAGVAAALAAGAVLALRLRLPAGADTPAVPTDSLAGAAARR